MKRILFSHFDHDDYLDYKRSFHAISTEFTVSNVETGEKLFNLLRFFTPDLLIVDITSASDDARSCLERLISEDKFSSLKIIIHSDAGQQDYGRDSQLSDNSYHLVKPFTTEHLRRTVEDALSIDWTLPGTISTQNNVLNQV